MPKMTFDDVLEVLHPIAVAAKSGLAALAVYNWLKGRQRNDVDPNLAAALAKLPRTASADEIVAVVAPFMKAAGDNVALTAGSDGGDNLHATDAVIEGGAGTFKGGDVTISCGAGGPRGKGGDVTIVGGRIKGGDATGA